MQMVDLSHTMNVHTPGWVGYAGNKMYYAQTLQTNGSWHNGSTPHSTSAPTSTGACMVLTAGATWPRYPLSFLVNKGAIVDISDMVDDWDIITPDMLTANVEIEKGDILIIHTGFNRYYEGKPQATSSATSPCIPAASWNCCNWMLDMEIKWFGIDAGSGDHPMRTTIRHMRPDLTRSSRRRSG